MFIVAICALTVTEDVERTGKCDYESEVAKNDIHSVIELIPLGVA